MRLTVITVYALLLAGCSEKPEREEASKKKNVDTPGAVPAEIVPETEPELDITIPVVLAWQASTVDSVGDVGRYNSLSYGPEGQLAIAYYDATAGNLKCAVSTVDGARISWRIDVVDSLGDVGLNPSLDHDPAGNPAIAYYDLTNRNLKYAAYRKGSWVIETVDEGAMVGQFSSLQHEPEGRPTISYYDRANGDLKYALRNEGGWRVTIVDSAGRVGLYNCLRYDPDGMPVISYQDGGKGELKCAVLYDDEWHSVIVDDGVDPAFPDDPEKKADVGYKGSLVYNAEGRPAVAYYDATNAVLKYAVYQSSVDDFKYNEKPRDQWQIESIDVIEGPDQVSSLSRGADGQLAISCREYKEKRLLYLTRSEDGWKKEPVFVAGLVGEVTSLSHAPNGRPAISCYSATDEELRLISWTIVPKEEAE